jgi:predicted nuclease of predicted toxin-antitoxin system
VTPLDFPLLTDENIAPDVVAGLRARGLDLRTVREEQLIGRPDVEILERATAQGRVVVTHDLAFARSALRAGASFVGMIYLHPGHISAGFVLQIVDALRASTVDVVAAVHRRGRTTANDRARPGANRTSLVAAIGSACR